MPPKVRMLKFGSAKTQKDRVLEQRTKQIESGRTTMALLRAYVVCHWADRVYPCPDLERGKKWAQGRGSDEFPVVIFQRGTEVYRYPDNSIE